MSYTPFSLQDSSEDEKERERFGEGYAHAVDCSDSDSDDDLVPYAMDDDPDTSQVVAPRYLRTLMQGEGRRERGEGGGERTNFHNVSVQISAQVKSHRRWRWQCKVQNP